MNTDRTRILIADDEPDHRLLLRILLHEFISPGIEVAEANDGHEALLLFQSWHPSLILMDLWMPHMSGDQAVREIRVHEDRMLALTENVQPVLIVAVTAAAFACDRTLAFTAGCDDYLGKPINFSEFLQKMMCHLSTINPRFLDHFQKPLWPPVKASPEVLCATR